MSYNRTSDRPKGNIRKVSTLCLGGGNVKTYFSKSGVFERHFSPINGIAWYKLNPIFCDHMGNFYT